MNYLVVEKNVTKVVGPIDEANFKETIKLFKRGGYKVTMVDEPPSIDTLMRWKANNEGLALDGCLTTGWCSCRHGFRSWLSIYKKILS